MKSFFYLVLTIVVLVAVSLNSDENVTQENANNEPASVQATTSMSSQLVSGLRGVLASLEKLKTVVELDKKEKRVNFAQELNRRWDKIEKQIEEKYPKDYEHIEESLYPLLAIAKKENPDIANIKQLIEATKTKIIVFKKKVSGE